MTDLPYSTAAERNKQPILDALRDLLGERGTALEIASGTGQHAVWFAAALADWVWQPTDADAGALPAIAARIAQSGLLNLRPPVLLDVMSTPWPAADAPFTERFDAIFCANMLHIAPPATCAALMQGAARHLQPDGVLITYGPYLEDGPVAPSNEAFDRSLRARDPVWGIRRLDDVVREAGHAGLTLRSRRPMPSNNLLLAFQRLEHAVALSAPDSPQR
jgi:SAM-dependent methyltransferase